MFLQQCFPVCARKQHLLRKHNISETFFVFRKQKNVSAADVVLCARKRGNNVPPFAFKLTNLFNLRFKAPSNEDRLWRKHCFPNISPFFRTGNILRFHTAWQILRMRHPFQSTRSPFHTEMSGRSVFIWYWYEFLFRNENLDPTQKPGWTHSGTGVVLTWDFDSVSWCKRIESHKTRLNSFVPEWKSPVSCKHP